MPQNFSAVFLDYIQAIRNPRDFLGRARRKFDRMRGIRKRQIVVCGAPRSGTTLFYNMLSISLNGFKFDKLERYSRDTIRLYDNHVSKVPLEVLEISRIVDRNLYRKEIIVLVVIRDIRDIITSIHPNVPDDYFIGYDASYEIVGQYPNYLHTLNLPGVGEIYRAIELLKDCADYSVQLVKYEDLIADPHRIQEMLRKRFGFSFRRGFSDVNSFYHQKGIAYDGQRKPLEPTLVKLDRAVTNDFIGRWKQPEHLERIRQQFSSYPGLFRILCDYGYESDDSWFHQIFSSSRQPIDESRGSSNGFLRNTA